MICASYCSLGNVETLGQTRPVAAGRPMPPQRQQSRPFLNSPCVHWLQKWHHVKKQHVLERAGNVGSQARSWELGKKQASCPSDAFTQSTEASSLIMECAAAWKLAEIPARSHKALLYALINPAARLYEVILARTAETLYKKRGKMWSVPSSLFGLAQHCFKFPQEPAFPFKDASRQLRPTSPQTFHDELGDHSLPAALLLSVGLNFWHKRPSSQGCLKVA